MIGTVEDWHPGDWCGPCFTCADTLSIPPSQSSFFPHTQNHSYDREELDSYSCQFFVWRSSANSGFKKIVTEVVRHHDQDERQSDAAPHWDVIRPVLLKAVAKHGAQDFSEKHWLRLIHEGSSKTRIEYCDHFKNSLACFRATQGHSGGIPIDPELMEIHSDSLQLERVSFSKELFFPHSILENGLIPVGKESDKGRQTVFFTPLNPFGGDSDEEEPRDDYTAQKSALSQSLET